uniref:Mitochondrial carrier protein n=2 Tax=Pseudo-nitzschia australis TaxID=44445 RepID=A0A7S4AJ65_9STRA|mmetsp:Transcript_26/g.59  ORF Transcript_26/g.59 Transcript_26/m.59 type:complete len:422 (+) Transcript_26:242-1507(+)
MKFLHASCAFVLLGICVEGRFFSNEIGNSLPALNYRTHQSGIPRDHLHHHQQQETNHPAFLGTGNSNSNSQSRFRKYRRGPLNDSDNSNDSAEILQVARTIESDVRGGSTAAANVVRTMTARRMESLKLLSGGAAGTVAACITNPLEVVKTQLQSSNAVKSSPSAIAKKILDVDGIPGFWRGLPPTLVGIIPSRSAYFYAYSKMKSFLDPAFPEGSPPNALVAGFSAGIVGNTLTNPIWMVRTRMQILVDQAAGQRQYAGYRDAIQTIFQEEGVGGFYKGITASYWGCFEGATQFLIYEQLKQKLIIRQNKKRFEQGLRPSQELSKATYFWAAAASKGVAAVATYPHEVARTRMREQAQAGIFKYQNGMWGCLGVMAKEEGFKSLYSGMGVHLMKVIPNSALMFLTYETVRGWLDRYEVVD